MLQIHSDIKPFQCLVRKEFLYDFKSGYDEYLPCQVFGVSSYEGHVLTFQILIEDKFMYSYIPVQALLHDDFFISHEYDNLESTNYFNCPAGSVNVHVFDILYDKQCQVFNKNGTYRGAGKYKMTFDWPQGNQLCHLINQGGQYILWPSHKLIFSDNAEDKLPNFKKLHREWILK